MTLTVRQQATAEAAEQLATTHGGQIAVAISFNTDETPALVIGSATPDDETLILLLEAALRMVRSHRTKRIDRARS